MIDRKNSRRAGIAFFIVLSCGGFACAQTPVYGYRVVDSFTHDSQAFTQGLAIDNGELFEGTGRYGHSSLRRVDLKTGKVLQQADLSNDFFGEGIVVFNNRIYQLTWLSNICFVYDRSTFELLDTFSYLTEGWGLTHDGTHLIMSDGSDEITFRDPESFSVVRIIQVQDGGQPVKNLNELEFIEGEIFSNVWKTDEIVRIDPATGTVTGRIDLKGLLNRNEVPIGQPVDVLNGIAYDGNTHKIYVTGKLWPKLFQIELTGGPNCLNDWPVH